MVFPDHGLDGKHVLGGHRGGGAARELRAAAEDVATMFRSALERRDRAGVGVGQNAAKIQLVSVCLVGYGFRRHRVGTPRDDGRISGKQRVVAWLG
jgi:hypothetical protein